MSLLALSYPHRVDAQLGGVWTTVETLASYYEAVAFVESRPELRALPVGAVEIVPLWGEDE